VQPIAEDFEGRPMVAWRRMWDVIGDELDMSLGINLAWYQLVSSSRDVNRIRPSRQHVVPLDVLGVLLWRGRAEEAQRLRKPRAKPQPQPRALAILDAPRDAGLPRMVDSDWSESDSDGEDDAANSPEDEGQDEPDRLDESDQQSDDGVDTRGGASDVAVAGEGSRDEE